APRVNAVCPRFPCGRFCRHNLGGWSYQGRGGVTMAAQGRHGRPRSWRPLEPAMPDEPPVERTLVPAQTVVTQGTVHSMDHSLVPPPPLGTQRPLPRVEGYDLLEEVGQGGMG